MKKIAFGGTFDPITNGHLWVIEEGLKLAEEIIIMVAQNSSKNPFFSDKERKEMIEQALEEKNLSHRAKVIVVKNEYTAQTAFRLGCEYQIRGLRSANDFDYEALIQKTNTDVLHGVKTIFVMPPRDLESVSSSFVKMLVGPPGWHWHVKKLVPSSVYNLWLEKFITHFVRQNAGLPEDMMQAMLKAVFLNYRSPSRHYHSLDHIAHCIEELQWVMANYDLERSQIESLVRSILVHDIIQNVKDEHHSDEELSAIWYGDFIHSYGLELSPLDKAVMQMIESTGYLSGGKMAETFEEKLLCSIDLAILAQPEEIYDLYSLAIREEYANIPDNMYVHGRINALKKLMERTIYLNEYYETSEIWAQRNMLREIEMLQKKAMAI
jgi:pantetheine-phosphate adenylyltransferase